MEIEVTPEHVEKTKGILDQVEHTAKDCSALIKALIQKIKGKEITTAKGISLLEVKNNLLLQYLSGLGGIVFNKVKGRSIQGHPLVDQLIELRIILEKMRPIDTKLRYQIDKLIRRATEKKMETDPLMHRANLDNLSDEGEEEEEEGDEKCVSKKDVYVPPKVAATPYDDEEEAPAKHLEKARKKSINKLLIRELQEEFLDTPTEISNKGEGFADQLTRHAKDKQRYEETYMTRLPTTKKEKHMTKSMSTIGVLGEEITDFRSKKASLGGKKKGMKRKKSGGGGSKKRFRKK